MFVIVCAGLEMDWLIIRIHASLLEGFRHGRPGRYLRTVLNRNDGFRNHFTSIRTDIICAPRVLSVLADKILTNPSVDAFARARLLAGKFNTRLFQFFFRFPYRRDFRKGIDDTGYRNVIHMPGVPGNDLHRGNPFFFRLVREHRTVNTIPNRENVVRLPECVDDYSTPRSTTARLLPVCLHFGEATPCCCS